VRIRAEPLRSLTLAFMDRSLEARFQRLSGPEVRFQVTRAYALAVLVSAAALLRLALDQNSPLYLPGVMLARLGPNVWHDSPAAAMATLEELEETARLMLLQPHTTALADAALDALRQSFGARW